jgi:hypothetical protein
MGGKVDRKLVHMGDFWKDKNRSRYVGRDLQKIINGRGISHGKNRFFP